MSSSARRIGLELPSTLDAPILVKPDAFADIRDHLRTRFGREQLLDGEMPTVPEPIGARDELPADVMILIDRSGSMGGQLHLVTLAALRIVRLLATGFGGPIADDHVGVVLFDSEPTSSLPLTPIDTKPGRAALRRALSTSSGGGTQFEGALTTGASLIARGRSDAHTIGVLFTDGESGESAEILRRAIAAWPIDSVHLIATPGVSSQWNNVGLRSVTPIGSLGSSPETLEWLMASRLCDALGLTMPERDDKIAPEDRP